MFLLFFKLLVPFHLFCERTIVPQEERPAIIITMPHTKIVKTKKDFINFRRSTFIV